MTGLRSTCCRVDDQSRTCIAPSVSSSYEFDMRAMRIVAEGKSSRLGKFLVFHYMCEKLRSSNELSDKWRSPERNGMAGGISARWL
jgi:hypothetical protein